MKCSLLFWLVFFPIAVSIILWWVLPPLPEFTKEYNTSLRSQLHFYRHRNKIIAPIVILLDWIGLGDRMQLSRSIFKSLFSLVYPLKPIDSDEMKSTDTNFNGVPVRIYLPSKSRQSSELGPAILYFHGGGWMAMSYEIHDKPVRALALSLGIVVVSANYRLAPEAKHPAQLDDCEAVLRHFMLHAHTWSVDPARIALAGDSAGGHLSATLSLRWRNVLAKQVQEKATSDFLHPIRMQILIYPALQLVNTTLNSYVVNRNDPLLPRSATSCVLCFLFGRPACFDRSLHAAWLAGNFTTVKTRAALDRYFRYDRLPADLAALVTPAEKEEGSRFRHDPSELHPQGDPAMEQRYLEGGKMLSEEVSPLFASDEALRTLPPTYLISMGHDILRDDGLFFTARLRELNVSVHLQHYQPYFHGWLNMEPEPIIRDIKTYLEKTNYL